MIALFCLSFQTILFYVCYKRAGLLPAPTLYVGYLLCCQFILYLLKIGLIEYEFALIWTTYSYITHYNIVAISFVMLSAFYTSTLIGLKRIDSAALIKEVERIRIAQEIIWLITGLLVARQAIDMASYDWSIIWSNQVYLSMTDPSYLKNSSGIVRFLNLMLIPCTIVTAFLFVYCFSRRNNFSGAILAIIVIWNVIFFWAAHSRNAALILAASAFSVLVLTKHRNLALLFLALSALSLVSALEGRSSGHHGLSSIPESIVNIASGDRNIVGILEFTVLNFFEGLFTFSEHFSKAVSFDPQYKNLSLSPLPSFIDGFASIREANEVKLFVVVPRGALDEILHFGVVHSAIYFTAQFLAIRLSLIALGRAGNVAALVLNFLLFCNLLIQMVYSVRTVFRIYLLVIALAVWLLARHRGARTRQPSLARVRHRVTAVRQP